MLVTACPTKHFGSSVWTQIGQSHLLTSDTVKSLAMQVEARRFRVERGTVLDTRKSLDGSKVKIHARPHLLRPALSGPAHHVPPIFLRRMQLKCVPISQVHPGNYVSNCDLSQSVVQSKMPGRDDLARDTRFFRIKSSCADAS